MQAQERDRECFSRFDVDTAVIVEKGIALQSMVSTGYAATFLKSEKVCAAVILRVLLREEERRGCPAQI